MKKAVLLANIGSPCSTDASDIKTYLSQFLMDPHVIQLPYIIRWILVNCLIVPTRYKPTQKAYERIWSAKGSPLVVLTQELSKKLSRKTKIPVFLGMRYGSHSCHEAFKSMKKEGITDVYIIPLYPQYAESTTRSIIEHVQHCNKDFGFSMQVQPPFYSDPLYLDTLIQHTKRYTKAVDGLLFSFHGLPLSHITKQAPSHCLRVPNCCINPPKHVQSSCYRHQALYISHTIAQKTGFDKRYRIAFQSRVGRQPWLNPTTENTIKELALNGIKHLGVICPSFVTDCLETLEEIGIEGKKLFIKNGGKSFTMIPCLNTFDMWVDTLSTWIMTRQGVSCS